MQFKHREKYQCRSLSGRKTPGQVRVMLAKFFRNRAKDLEYEKYKILLRLHNLGVEEEVPFVKSRVNLIDK